MDDSVIAGFSRYSNTIANIIFPVNGHFSSRGQPLSSMKKQLGAIRLLTSPNQSCSVVNVKFGPSSLMFSVVKDFIRPILSMSLTNNHSVMSFRTRMAIVSIVNGVLQMYFYGITKLCSILVLFSTVGWQCNVIPDCHCSLTSFKKIVK